MRWYWWLLVGLVVGAGAVFLVPSLLKKKGNPDSLQKARDAKEEKREAKLEQAENAAESK